MFGHPVRIFPPTKAFALAILSPVALISSLPVGAAGFALIEHGASGLGNSYAGASAVSADSSTVWFNPAGMSELDGRKVAVAGHLISSSTDFTNEGTSLAAALGGTPISGPDTADPGTVTLLPNFYYVAPINQQWKYGLSIGVPFGSSTDYDDDWVGRYTTVESSINVIDVNPSLSYRVSDKVSLGFGVSVQRLSAVLENNIDSGAVCLNFVGQSSITETQCFNEGLTPGNQAVDSVGEVDGDSTALGFNLGALFSPTDTVKIGLAYRHGVDHDLEGDASFVVNPNLAAVLASNTSASPESQFATANILNNVPGAAEVSLPASFSVSAAWQVHNKVELLTDLTWTDWSVFDELRVEFENPAQPDSVSLQEWEDTLRFSAGLNYQHNSKLTWRAGYAFDEEAIPSAQRRTARIPGNDRTWLSAGIGYKVSQRFSFDIGYAHLFLDDTPVDNPNLEAPGGSIVRGVFEPAVDIFSAQLNWDFN